MKSAQRESLPKSRHACIRLSTMQSMNRCSISLSSRLGWLRRLQSLRPDMQLKKQSGGRKREKKLRLGHEIRWPQNARLELKPSEKPRSTRSDCQSRCASWRRPAATWNAREAAATHMTETSTIVSSVRVAPFTPLCLSSSMHRYLSSPSAPLP